MQQNKPIVSCRRVNKTFGSFIAIKNITFNLQSGDKVGLVGLNGTGKSTPVKMIMKEYLPDEGTINFGV